DVRVDDQITGLGEREHQPLDQLDRELTGMDRLLDVVVLHVRDHPHVTRVLAERMAGRLPRARTLEVPLARILLWHPHRIEMEDVGGAGEPEDRLVTAREATRAVEAVLEVPHDPVPERESVTLEDRMEQDVEREDLAALDMVADLPRDAPARSEDADTLRDHRRLLREVDGQRAAALVRLPQIV